MPAGILAVTLLVAATTIDDAIWLIPYCTSPHLPFLTKAIHALTFVGTLELMAIFCSVTAFLFQGWIIKEKKKNDIDIDAQFILGLAGAILCWVLAIGLFVKKMNKRRRKAEAMLRKEKELVLEVENGNVDVDADADATETPASEETPLVEKSDGDDGNNGEDSGNNANDDDDASASSSSTSTSGGGNESERDIPTTPSIKMVISLTMLGALDEISYFPALLVGNVFTPTQLCIGTCLASILILIIVSFFLTKFQPLVDFLDSIPLYAIVGIFAIILTLGLIFPL